MLATLDVALLGLPSSKLGLLVAEATGFCAVGFCTLGLGETRGSEDGGADVRLQPATISKIRAIAPNCRIFFMLHRSLASPVPAYQHTHPTVDELKNAAIDGKGNCCK
ncbi:hypothetical protein [Microcoleus sp. Pol17_C1]|uniref:hypothetical protein n=1 Tax=unclassified Microcoleus TaxID=2642155 RepID=UPI002FD2D6E5